MIVQLNKRFFELHRKMGLPHPPVVKELQRYIYLDVQPGSKELKELAYHAEDVADRDNYVVPATPRYSRPSVNRGNRPRLTEEGLRRSALAVLRTLTEHGLYEYQG